MFGARESERGSKSRGVRGEGWVGKWEEEEWVFIKCTKPTLPYVILSVEAQLLLKEKKRKNGFHLLVHTQAMEIETWELFMVDAVI